MTGGTPSCGSNCAGAPYLAALYVGTNLLFNISLLTLLRAAGDALTLYARACSYHVALTMSCSCASHAALLDAIADAIYGIYGAASRLKTALHSGHVAEKE